MNFLSGNSTPLGNSIDHYFGAWLREKRMHFPHDAQWEAPLEVIQEVPPQVQQRRWCTRGNCFLLIFSSDSQKCWTCLQPILSKFGNYSLNIPKTLKVLLSSVIFGCQDWTMYSFSKIESLNTVRTIKQEVRYNFI